MIIFGGLNQTSMDKSTPLNDFYILDLEFNHWINPIIGGSIPSPCFGMASYGFKFDNSEEIVVLGGNT